MENENNMGTTGNEVSPALKNTNNDEEAGAEPGTGALVEVLIESVTEIEAEIEAGAEAVML